MRDFKPRYKQSPLIGFEAKSTTGADILVEIELKNKLCIRIACMGTSIATRFNKEDAYDFVDQLKRVIENMEP